MASGSPFLPGVFSDVMCLSFRRQQSFTLRHNPFCLRVFYTTWTDAPSRRRAQSPPAAGGRADQTRRTRAPPSRVAAPHGEKRPFIRRITEEPLASEVFEVRRPAPLPAVSATCAVPTIAPAGSWRGDRFVKPLMVL